MDDGIASRKDWRFIRMTAEVLIAFVKEHGVSNGPVAVMNLTQLETAIDSKALIFVMFSEWMRNNI